MNSDPLVDILVAAVGVLESQQVAYAVTGSIASSIYGEPHASIDVDLVVRMNESQARGVARGLPRRFYCTEEMMVEAARNCGMVNLIDQETGLKVDLSVLDASPFHQHVIARKTLMSFGDDVSSFYVVSPEDIILMKLVWRKDSRSRKQWTEALGVVRVWSSKLDWVYLFEQAKELGIKDDLTALSDEGEKTL